MLKRYKVYDKEKILLEDLVTDKIEPDFFELKYPECSIYESFYMKFEKSILTQFFLEIKSDKFFPTMYEELKKTVLQAVAIIEEDFEIQARDIRIYFNGENGFYIVVPYVAMGFPKDRRNFMHLYYKECISYIKEKIKSDYIHVDEHGLHSMHLIYESYNYSSGYAARRILRDDLEQFSVLQFLKYCKQEQKKEFRNGVRTPRYEPAGKYKELVERVKIDQQESEVLEEIHLFFESNKNRRKLDSIRHLEKFKERAASEERYSAANKYIFYMYNDMLNAMQEEESDQDRMMCAEEYIKLMLFHALELLYGPFELEYKDYIFGLIIHTYQIPDFVIGFDCMGSSVQDRLVVTIVINTFTLYGKYEIDIEKLDLNDVLHVFSGLNKAMNSLITKEDWNWD